MAKATQAFEPLFLSGFPVGVILALGTVGVLSERAIAGSPEMAEITHVTDISETHSLTNLPNPLGLEPKTDMAQVTSVSQLSDVKTTDWYFGAVKSLVERYQCIDGYPDGTFRPDRAIKRSEFVAALNACLNAITGRGDSLASGDLATIQRLQQEFAAELATLRGRLDAVEGKVEELEENQFSTTTKLQGEVAFTLADTFGGDGRGGDDDPTQTVLTNRIRLQFVSSFTGKDKLFTRLTGGNIANAFADELGTQEGRFAFDGQGDNTIVIDRLHYVFPVTKKLEATVMASLGGHWFYSETFNPELEAGGGATGAISRLAERNPLYRLNAGGQGIGLRYKPSKTFEASLGYLARGGNNPDLGAGLFNGNFSGFAQLVVKPSKDLRFGVNYSRGLDKQLGSNLFSATGTNLGSLNPSTLADLDGAGGLQATDIEAASTNNFGAGAYWKIGSGLDLRGWFGYTDARLLDVGNADVLTYGAALGFPNLGKKGNFGAIIVGVSPYLIDLSLDDSSDPDFSEDIPLHVEALYKYKVNKNLMLTPGFIWLANPNQDNDNDSIFIGVLRSTFTF